MSTEYVGKIVLVQRGKCSYITKEVMNIQERGGIAVIVGDNVPRNWLLTLYADGFWPL
jgi:PA domain